MYYRIHYYKAIHYSNRTSPYWLYVSSKTSQDWFFDWSRGPTNIALRLIYGMIKTLRIIKKQDKKNQNKSTPGAVACEAGHRHHK
ncbi:hypothetical protein L208DRAFT_1390987 [Tricholoma matsutake]|nr:hypothetical protein L208DRAFT_1390987 [Tricholoma matsutake 945]